jgi:hypothetical protein
MNGCLVAAAARQDKKDREHCWTARNHHSCQSARRAASKRMARFGVIATAPVRAGRRTMTAMPWKQTWFLSSRPIHWRDTARHR